MRCYGWKKEVEETEWLLAETHHSRSDTGYMCKLQFEVMT